MDVMCMSGSFPNVAVEAGRDPAEVMEEYGVEPRGLRTAAYEYERRIAELEDERDRALEKAGKLFDKCLELQTEVNRQREALDAYEMGTMYELYREKDERIARLEAGYAKAAKLVREMVPYLSDDIGTGAIRRRVREFWSGGL